MCIGLFCLFSHYGVACQFGLFALINKTLHVDFNPPVSGLSLQNTMSAKNPAGISQLQTLVTQQGEMLVAYQEQLTFLQNTNTTLIKALCAPFITRPESVKMALPEKLDRASACCHGFLQQYDLFFSHQPEVYSEDNTKRTFLM